MAFLKLFSGSANAALAGLFLFGVFHPADEFIASQRRKVDPSGKGRDIG